MKNWETNKKKQFTKNDIKIKNRGQMKILWMYDVNVNANAILFSKMCSYQSGIYGLIKVKIVLVRGKKSISIFFYIKIIKFSCYMVFLVD